MQKKIALGLIGTMFLLSVVAVSADQTGSIAPLAPTSTGKLISQDRMELRDKAKLLREKNKELKKQSQEARKEFRSTNSGELHDMKKEMTASGKLELKELHEDKKDFIKSLSGMTLEQKAQYLSGMEDKIRTTIEARFAGASGALLEKRMAVYEQNALRRAELIANQLEIRANRGTLKSTEIDALIAKITAEIQNLSTEKKTKLISKIDDKIKKIQANKRLPDASKTEIVAKLTTLRDLLSK